MRLCDSEFSYSNCALSLQACFKMLPIAGGVVLLFLVAFGLYVNSIPAKIPTPQTSPAPEYDSARILQAARDSGGKVTLDQLKEAGMDVDKLIEQGVDPDNIRLEPNKPPEKEADGENVEADQNNEHVEL